MKTPNTSYINRTFLIFWMAISTLFFPMGCSEVTPIITREHPYLIPTFIHKELNVDTSFSEVYSVDYNWDGEEDILLIGKKGAALFLWNLDGFYREPSECFDFPYNTIAVDFGRGLGQTRMEMVVVTLNGIYHFKGRECVLVDSLPNGFLCTGKQDDMGCSIIRQSLLQDIDGNGQLDILIPYSAQGTWRLRIYLQSKAGFQRFKDFPTQSSVEYPFPKIFFGDIDNDTRRDMVLDLGYAMAVYKDCLETSNDSPDLIITYDEILTSSHDHKDQDYSPNMGRLILWDLNADGFMDGIVILYNKPLVLIFYGQRGGNFKRPHEQISVPGMLKLGPYIQDFNLDGKSDIGFVTLASSNIFKSFLYYIFNGVIPLDIHIYIFFNRGGLFGEIVDNAETVFVSVQATTKLKQDLGKGVYFGDIDNNQLPDLVKITEKRCNIYYNFRFSDNSGSKESKYFLQRHLEEVRQILIPFVSNYDLIMKTPNLTISLPELKESGKVTITPIKKRGHHYSFVLRCAVGKGKSQFILLQPADAQILYFPQYSERDIVVLLCASHKLF